MNELVGQFLGSSQGQTLLQDLVAQGLSEDQAKGALSATAEGVAQQSAGAGLDLGALGGALSSFGSQSGSSLASGVLGALGGAGGLGSAVSGLFGGSPAATDSATTGLGPLQALAAPVATFVANKTGLSPAMATLAVNAVLPKLAQLLSPAKA